MDDPQVVSRDEWLAARKQLLAKEKEFTRQRDALNAERRRLPMVEIDKEHAFEGRDGKASLPERQGRDKDRARSTPCQRSAGLGPDARSCA